MKKSKKKRIKQITGWVNFPKVITKGFGGSSLAFIGLISKNKNELIKHENKVRITIEEIQ